MLKNSTDVLHIYVFASVLRSDCFAKPMMKRVVATSEIEARRQLSSKYVLSLSCRMPTYLGIKHERRFEN
ncbi:host cell division inhibitor Icd-like protein [Rouxiella chamberiensis]